MFEGRSSGRRGEKMLFLCSCIFPFLGGRGGGGEFLFQNFLRVQREDVEPILSFFPAI